MGTTLGMVIADAFGIVAGIVLRKHIPAKTIKWISTIIFVLFGLSGVHKILSARLSPTGVWGITLFISACTIYGAYYLTKSHREAS